MNSPSTTVPGKVGIVTVTFNSANVLPEFLQSIRQQKYPNLVVYAIDNASHDNSVAILSEHEDERFRVISNNRNVGVAAGNNDGIRLAMQDNCEFVLLLNNDVAFGPDLVSSLVSSLSDRAYSMNVPLIYFYDRPTRIWAAGGGFQPRYGYLNFHHAECEEDIGQYSNPVPVQYAPTCCVLIHSDVFRKIGLMDERYFVYGDDVDFMYRAMRADIKMLLVPQARLWHKVNVLTGGSHSDFSLYYGARGRLLFLSKHFGPFVSTMWFLLYTIYYSLRPLVGMDTWHRSAVRRRGLLDGIKSGRTNCTHNLVQTESSNSELPPVMSR